MKNILRILIVFVFSPQVGMGASMDTHRLLDPEKSIAIVGVPTLSQEQEKCLEVYTHTVGLFKSVMQDQLEKFEKILEETKSSATCPEILDDLTVKELSHFSTREIFKKSWIGFLTERIQQLKRNFNAIRTGMSGIVANAGT